MSQDANEFLAQSGSGYEAVKFNDIGDKIAGTIMDDPTTVTRPNLNDGTPEKQLPINLDTANGPRTLWVRRGFLSGAINDAVKEAGAPGLQIGGKLGVQLIELRDVKKPKPAKVFKAQYQPPTKTVDLEEIF